MADLVALLKASGTEQDARARIAEWSAAIGNDHGWQQQLYRAQLTADMGGQLFVREIELGGKVRALDASTTPAFLRAPFEAAIEQFLGKRVMAPEDFYDLSDGYRANAFTASRLSSDYLRERAYRLLADALRDGSTVEAFAAGLEAETESLGVSVTDHAYLDNVFRTNVAGAYGAGRYRQIIDPAVMAARPYVQYRTAQDSRVRPSHAAMDGQVFAADDPSWRSIAPPNGFQCRCGIVTLESPDGARVVTRADLPNGAGPDEGFDAPPI